MNLAALKKTKLPAAPGIYRFKDAKGAILYVGKATSLKDRVRSYFNNDLIATRGPRLVDMVTRAAKVDFEVTDSVLEALLLEGQLIKKYLPPYNTDGKDDKSYTYVVVTAEEFPRVLLVRGRELPLWEHRTIRKRYGPFPHGGQLKEALKIIRRIFPYFDTKRPVADIRSRTEKGKLRFNQQIGLYPSDGNAAAYNRNIRNLMLLFEGKKEQILKTLEREMKNAAKLERFEAAGEAKRQMFALQHIQDVSLIKDELRSVEASGMRIEAYDVAHLSGKNMVGVMTVVENGLPEKSQYRKFRIRTLASANDPAALREILERRLAHPEWQYPKLIVVDGGAAQLNVAQKVLEESGYRIPVVAVTKDEHHRPVKVQGNPEYAKKFEADILLANHEAHRFSVAFHRKRRGASFRSGT